MSTPFVPFVTAPISTGDMARFQLKVLPQADAKAVFAPLPDAANPTQPATACGQPTVTLQRQGDVISAIRVECVCGQVIELACSY